MKERELE